jgi:hypothetical protein
VYLLVLGMAVIITVIGLGAVAVSRVQARSAGGSQEWSEAQAITFSAVEHALVQIDRTANWRSAYDQQTIQKSLGRGTFTWRLVDEADGDLTNDATTPFTVLARGTVRDASCSLRVHVTMPSVQIVSGVSALGTVSVDNSTIDSFDSGAGPYGGPNVGAEAVVASNSTAPGGVRLTSASRLGGSVAVGPSGDPNVVFVKDGSSTLTGTVSAMAQPLAIATPPAPTGMGPSLGDWSYQGGGPFVLSGNLHVDDLSIESDTRVQISGNVTLLAEGTVDIWNGSGIEVLPGASLKLYHRGNLRIRDRATNTVSGLDLSRLKFINLGTSPVQLSDGTTSTEGVIISPGADVQITGGSQIYGAVVGNNISLTGGAAIHEDKRITNLTDPVTLPGASKPQPDAWNRIVE